MYYLKRIAMIPVLLFVISLLAFTLEHLLPGGPFDRDRAPATPEIERNLKAKFHLDEPVFQQYLRYASGLARGDFGPSLKYRNHSVNDIIAQALPVSMTIGLLAFGFTMAVGLPIGYYTAVRRGQWPDYVGGLLALLMVCVPGFVIAPLLIMAFALKWRLLPAALWGSPMHLILPVIALGLFFAGKVARLMREGMLNTMRAPFIVTARAKGLGENAIMIRHALRLAILPVVSYSGPLLADLLTGSFVVESIFQLPGIGIFFVNSISNRDYTMTVGLVVLYALLLIGLNLVVDFAYTLLDPRVKYE